MILVLAGTQDGRELAETLTQSGFQVMASVVSSYGRDLIRNNRIIVNARPLDTNQLIALIHSHQIAAVIDASHPYAINVSLNAMEACRLAGIRYVRFERPAVPLPSYEKLHVVENYPMAAETAAGIGRIVFLTTGSRNLKTFKSAPQLAHHRLIARVLPDPAVLRECIHLGFKPCDIIAMQGPFSHELNVLLFKEYKAEVIITKNSGNLGGSDTKITAAIELDLPIIVIDRPKIDYQTVVYNSSDIIGVLTEVV
ncbi:precorrin-6A reductase [bacterium BFN5]|nr:precorrin-6A reductase [bacterium BFN5]